MMTDRQRNVGSVLAVGLLAFIAYALVAPASLCGADNPEFATLAVRDGVAHPPGYPLYTLYLRIMSWLPGGTVAHSAAIATAVLGAGTIATLAAAGMRWGVDPARAALGSLLIGVELHVLAAHTHAEVFALNNLVAAAICWAAAPDGDRPIATAAGLGLLAGLGLSNHHSIVLMAPIGLWALWRAVRSSERPVVAITAALAAGVAGLTPYLLLFAAPDCVDCVSWGRFEGFADLWHHVTRSDYGSTSLGVGGVRDPATQLAAFFGALAHPASIAIPLVALGGFVVAARRDRWQAAALVATAVLAGPMFVALFNTNPEGIGADIVARFYALPVVVLGVPVALALSAVPRKALAVVVVVIAAYAGLNGSAVSGKCTGVIDAYARDILEPLPPDAIVFGTGDHRTFGVGHMQYVREVRPDVHYVDGKLLANDWYAARVETRLGVELPRSTATTIPIAQFVQTAQQTGRPVFTTHIFADALTTFPSYPLGPVIRLLAPGERPPDPRSLAAQNAEVFDKLRLQQDLDDVTNPWESEVYTHYARPWLSLGDAFEHFGDAEAATRARDMAAIYQAPTQR